MRFGPWASPMLLTGYQLMTCDNTPRQIATVHNYTLATRPRPVLNGAYMLLAIKVNISAKESTGARI